MPRLDVKSHDASHTRRNFKSNKTYTQDIKIKSEIETSRIRT